MLGVIFFAQVSGEVLADGLNAGLLFGDDEALLRRETSVEVSLLAFVADFNFGVVVLDMLRVDEVDVIFEHFVD